jgi:hypothetical protein
MPPRAPSPPVDPDRLHGWKEISTFVGKGLRTVQRWEKQYGLPVRRLGDGRDIVFASRREIEDWLRRSSSRRAKEDPVTGEETGVSIAGTGAGTNGRLASAPSGEGSAGTNDHGASSTNGAVLVVKEAPAAAEAAAVAPADNVAAVPVAGRTSVAPRTRGVFGLLATGLVGAAAAGWWWVAGTRPATTPDSLGQPASWRVEDDTLRVFNAAGVPLWTYRIDATLSEDRYSAPDRDWAGGVAIEDLDGDGRREVLFRSLSEERETRSALYCLNADGTVRWTRRLDDRMRFGDDTYTAPWVVNHMRVLPNGDGTRSVWVVFTHGLMFPSVLERIDAGGNVQSRHWSNGYIESLTPATWKGQPVLLVGAANNEHKASSLAILPRDDATATAPSANPKYRCSTCPPRDPLAFVVFPPNPLGLLRRETAAVVEAWILDQDGLMVHVTEPPFGTPLPEGLVYYTLDSDLRPVAVEASVGYERLHEWWWKAGRIDRPFSPAEVDRMLPILKWNGTGYTPYGLAGTR